MGGGLPLDHVALALARLRHIGRDRAGDCAELRRVPDQMGDARAPDFVLAGHTGDVGTGPPMYRRSTRTTRCPDGARCHASKFPPEPLPRIRTSKCSACCIFPPCTDRNRRAADQGRLRRISALWARGADPSQNAQARTDLKPARTSSEKSFGCSQAA